MQRSHVLRVSLSILFHSDIPHLEKLEIADFFDFISSPTVSSMHESLVMIQMLPCSMILSIIVFVTKRNFTGKEQLGLL